MAQAHGAARGSRPQRPNQSTHPTRLFYQLRGPKTENLAYSTYNHISIHFAPPAFVKGWFFRETGDLGWAIYPFPANVYPFAIFLRLIFLRITDQVEINITSPSSSEISR